MKVFDLFEGATPLAGAELATEKDVKVEKQSDGSFKVSVSATAGPLVSLMRDIAFNTQRKRGFKVTTKSGTQLPRWEKFKANGIIVSAPDKEALMAQIGAALKKHNNQIKRDTRWKEKAPERAKDSAKYASEQNKKRRAEYEEKYGKGTAARVTYRQEGGDDGYQYVVRVDGHAKWGGLTRSEAEHYAHQERDELAKKAKLGKYAK